MANTRPGSPAWVNGRAELLRLADATDQRQRETALLAEQQAKQPDARIAERELFDFAAVLVSCAELPRNGTVVSTDETAVRQLARRHPELMRLLALFYIDTREGTRPEGRVYTIDQLRDHDND